MYLGVNRKKTSHCVKSLGQYCCPQALRPLPPRVAHTAFCSRQLKIPLKGNDSSTCRRQHACPQNLAVHPTAVGEGKPDQAGGAIRARKTIPAAYPTIEKAAPELRCPASTSSRALMGVKLTSEDINHKRHEAPGYRARVPARSVFNQTRDEAPPWLPRGEL